MRFSSLMLLSVILLRESIGKNKKNERSKRYLLMTKDTQWGVFLTVSVPLHPETTTSVAWFFEANYYAVDNATYFDPLLGDITVSRDRTKRSLKEQTQLFTRSLMYESIEAMLEQHGYPGRACLLRAICENSRSHLHHNGVLGDLLHVLLTPSSSEPEEGMEDYFYEAQYIGEERNCIYYEEECPINPLEFLSIHADDLLVL